MSWPKIVILVLLGLSLIGSAGKIGKPTKPMTSEASWLS